MSSRHLPRYHVQEAAEAHAASTAGKLDAGIPEKYTRTLGPRGLEGSLPTPPILGVPEAPGNLSTTTEPLITGHVLTSRRVRACSAALPVFPLHARGP